MRFGRQERWAVTPVFAAMAVTALAGTLAAAQPQQQNQVPDAPRPQALPQLNTVTPVRPAAVDAPLPTAPAPTAQTSQKDDNMGAPAPTATLPTAAIPQAKGEADDTALPPSTAGPHADAAHPTLVVHVNYVEVPFTVKDSKGQQVPGLTSRDVRIYENGTRLPIARFTTDPFPMSVALVIDQSVTFDTMEKINTALGALQGAFSPYDEVAIFTYNNGVKEQTGFTAAQSARLGVALERSKGSGREPLGPNGGPMAHGMVVNNQEIPNPENNGMRGPATAITVPKEYHTLNDAILEAARTVAKASPGRRRLIYVISEGKEYGSKAKEKDVIHFLQTNNIAVYATLVGDSSVPGIGFLDRIHLPLTMRDDVLPRYAAATGGQCDPEFRPRGIEQSFARIAATVRTQYTIGYYSHEPVLDGKFRTTEVRVLRPNLTVIAPPGYYPRPRNSMPAQNTPRVVPTSTPQ